MLEARHPQQEVETTESRIRDANRAVLDLRRYISANTSAICECIGQALVSYDDSLEAASFEVERRLLEIDTMLLRVARELLQSQNYFSRSSYETIEDAKDKMARFVFGFEDKVKKGTIGSELCERLMRTVEKLDNLKINEAKTPQRQAESDRLAEFLELLDACRRDFLIVLQRVLSGGMDVRGRVNARQILRDAAGTVSVELKNGYRGVVGRHVDPICVAGLREMAGAFNQDLLIEVPLDAAGISAGVNAVENTLADFRLLVIRNYLPGPNTEAGRTVLGALEAAAMPEGTNFI